MITDSLYRYSPICIQNLGISLYGLYWKNKRFGKLFREEVGRFKERESWDYEQLAEHALKQIRSQLKLAGSSTPYYRDLFKKTGLSEYDIENLQIEDLGRLPLLEKEVLRTSPEELLVQGPGKSRSPKHYLSSGTTGTPVKIYLDKTTHQKITAAREARSLNWAGVSYDQPRSMIGGRLVVPQADSRPPFWRYNYAEKQLYMSAFHISHDNVHAYVNALNRYRPTFMTGYASSHYFLARMILEQGIQVHSPKAVITSSEKLTGDMRKTIGEAFKSRVWEEYGSVENCVLATECRDGKLHLNIDFGWVEVLGDDGTRVGNEENGEIVATGFMNNVQPLIRYRIGDYGAISLKRCSCGSHLPILKDLIGRIEDVFIGPDGREMVRFHGIFVGLPHVKEGQIIQETLKDVTIKIVPEQGYGETDKSLIAQRIQDRLGKINMRIELVDKIPRTDRGKFRAVISKVKRQITNQTRLV